MSQPHPSVHNAFEISLDFVLLDARAHYELFTRALEAENVGEGAVCLVHPTCGPTQVSPPLLHSMPLLDVAYRMMTFLESCGITRMRS